MKIIKDNHDLLWLPELRESLVRPEGHNKDNLNYCLGDLFLHCKLQFKFISLQTYKRMKKYKVMNKELHLFEICVIDCPQWR